ncbi:MULTISPECIES: adenylate/guanylate cyclase domain-containing protein [Candidatus Nitrosocaldus]|jgi:class 3 adenylate cyclase|uniref:Adenylate/guanylate cyclase (Modular protein) n=1 Tax=Candidatus Nitrosocaldus cavascurensis TaxID=2058097 RepID=A0A2K5AQP2_9ARCH|nr:MULTISPECIES: adenylate/guanylate cyclase domain-containing protein [Candidatus Nitrosocaldus]SPC33978.1 Putative adenylate/guanylate cyclase (modular protein) [Candidatus Nitrosocaldus cavascurensis]
MPSKSNRVEGRRRRGEEKEGLEFTLEKVMRGSNREDKFELIIKLDPKRYERKTIDGEVGYLDTHTNTFIPEDALKLIFDEMIKQPIQGVGNDGKSRKDLYSSIVESQARVKKMLKDGLRFDSVITPSEKYLASHINMKLDVIVLYADIVDSTAMSMSLPADRLANLIKIFMQEMSYIIAAYHGYVLKYAGDCVIAFFPVGRDAGEACARVVNCARAMLNITRYAINQVLKEYGYPELKIKIGIDLGENQIVRLGGTLDLLGYTMSITAKIVELAKPWQIVIGKWVYDALAEEFKRSFKELRLRRDIWNYRDSREGKYYNLYTLKERKLEPRIRLI